MTVRHIAALFTANVRERWENTLTIYFEEIFFFEGIETEGGLVHVRFRGNPTDWECAHHRAYLTFDAKNLALPRLEFGFTLDKGDDDLQIRFSDVDVSRITQTPETLMQAIHVQLAE